MATVTSLRAGPIASFLDSVILTIKVGAAAGGAVPTGSVTLYYGSFAIATATLDNSGSATLAFPAVIVKLGIAATYNGASGFLTSTSDLLTSNLIGSRF